MTETRKKSGQHWLLALKLTATVGLVAFLLSRADWDKIGQSFAQANWFLLALVFLAMALSVIISAWKWRLLLDIHGIQFSFSRLNRWYFIAMFFNNFLPTGIGGDGYRVMKTWKNERSRAGAVIAVFMERLTGIVALLLLGFAGGVIGWWLDGDWLSRWIVIFGLVGGGLTLVVGTVLLKTGAINKLLQSPRCPSVVRTTFEHLADYKAKPGESAEVMAVSFGFHFLSIVWWLLLIASVGAHLPVYHLVVVVAILSIVTILPLSINGIGLVDGSFIYLAGQYGLEYEQGLTIMLLLRALMIPISLIGAWHYLKEKKGQTEHVRN